MKRCEVRKNLKLCTGCRSRRARYLYRGRVAWDRQHDLCLRCWRSLLSAARSGELHLHHA